jgi:post-segregation antitoxin (ccd killing protein)
LMKLYTPVVCGERPDRNIYFDRAKYIFAELLELPLSVLRKRARSLGVTDDEIETAEDTNEPVAALADLAIARSGMQKHQTTAIATDQSMRAKLAGLNVSALKKRALAAGVREQSLRATEDSDLPMREAVVNLIVAQAKSQSPSSAQEQTLRNELGSLKLSQLKKRAYSSSVDKGSAV